MLLFINNIYVLSFINTRNKLIFINHTLIDGDTLLNTKSRIFNNN